MTEQRLRDELQQAPIDDGARARALGVVRAAFLEGEPVRRRRRLTPALTAIACVLAVVVVAVAVTEPGDAVARWVRDVLGVGREHARPALVRVPGGGRLLVTVGGRSSVAGAWVASADGSRRRLGDYEGASWSPHGRFVVAWRGGELTAVEPNGLVRWSLTRRGPIATARWSRGLGYRIAYVSGTALRVVAGDGTGDHRYAPASDVAPAWRPDGAHVLAYVDRRDHVRVAEVDSRRQLWRSAQVGGATELAWSPDGRRLLIATPAGWRVLGADGLVLSRGQPPRGFTIDDVAWAPDGERIAVVRRSGSTGEVVLADPVGRDGERLLFSGPGRFGSVAFSPDGRRLLVPWPEADQWLFLSVERGGHVGAVANIARQFARGPRPGPFPDAVEWCCS
jgi:dipeptidyl aminopeptidase/acylaminoacyl peptidase